MTETKEGAAPAPIKSDALPSVLDALPLTLTVRIGTATRTVRELSQLSDGTEITLGARTTDPVELCVEDRVVARGELTEGPDGGLALKVTEVAAG